MNTIVVGWLVLLVWGLVAWVLGNTCLWLMGVPACDRPWYGCVFVGILVSLILLLLTGLAGSIGQELIGYQ